MSMTQLCGWVGISRQAWYQYQARRQIRQVQEADILKQVRQIRQRHKRMGTRKLLQKMGTWLLKKGYQIGRDRLFELLRQAGLLLKPKRRQTRTTWASSWRCQKHLADLELVKANQAYVSDITYIRLTGGFAYLTLITDAFSRYVVGYALSPRLTTDGSLEALDQALAQRPDMTQPLIHHSDRGSQFTDQRSYKIASSSLLYFDRIGSLLVCLFCFMVNF